MNSDLVPPEAISAQRVVPIGELARVVAALLERSFPLLWVGGEISNLTRAASGHWYFVLKDRDAQARCVMFRNRNQNLDWAPRGKNEPGQLHLELALMAARPLGKNFEDQQRPVIDRQLQMALKIALLGGAERLVEQHLNGAGFLRQCLDLVGFSAADKQSGVRCPAFTGNALHRLHARCLCQQTKLLKAAVKIRQAQINADKNG